MRFLFLLLIPSVIFSQIDDQSKKFDSIFFNVAVNVSSANPSKALQLADSLALNAANKNQQIKSLMLVADILSKQEKRGEAIIKALEVLEIAKEEKDYVFQARIYGFLSSEYRSIGFLDKGKVFLNKGIEISRNIPDEKKVADFMAMGNYELAEYALEEKEYSKAIAYLELALLTYKQEEDPQTRYFMISNSEEMIGHSYEGLGEIKKAISHFSKANLYINKAGAGNSIWAASIYHGLGNAFLESKNIDSAGVYLNKALVISEKSNHGSLKESVFKSVSEYYNTIKELDSFAVYTAKHNEQLNKNTEQKRLMINSAYNALNIQINNKSSNNIIYIIVVIVFLLFIGIYYKKKALFSTSKVKSPDIILSKKTEEDLAMKLKEFEESNKFLDKNMSLPTLIGLLNTNTKYFRTFIKNNKNTDYNNYINELRIQYVLDKFKTDKEYLNYKISYLADECGFSSHSKFSASFKNVTGISPSEYIRSIKNDVI
jgi:AraC-like DNA-binding protein